MIIDFPKDEKTLLNYWDFGENCYKIYAFYDHQSDSFYSFDVVKNTNKIHSFNNKEECLAAILEEAEGFFKELSL